MATNLELEIKAGQRTVLRARLDGQGGFDKPVYLAYVPEDSPPPPPPDLPDEDLKSKAPPLPDQRDGVVATLNITMPAGPNP